jgi:hypothetical protein
MSPKARWIWIPTLTVLATTALAQNAGDVDDEARPRRATKIPTEGFWPTRTMMDRFIDRITDDMSGRYQFDDEQLELTRDMFKARFPEFLNNNRAEIQTLVNEYIEALLNQEAPAVEHVAEWAQRVQPLLAEFGEVVTEVTEGMHEYLTDDQAARLDGEMAAFQTGMSMAQGKLNDWANGGYDPETEWIHSNARRDHDEDHGDEEVAAAAEAASDPDTVATVAEVASKDAWTIYTERFIQRYQLDDEQKQKAYAFLFRQQQRRDDYLRRKADEMARITRLLDEAETEEERTAALESYNRLNAPIERIFQQLKDRLDTLPTRAQRRDAAQAGLEEAEDEPKPPSSRAAPSDEQREKLESLGYVEPAATQPSQPTP